MGEHERKINYFMPQLQIINTRPEACPEYMSCPRVFKGLRLLMGGLCFGPEFKGCIIYKLLDWLR